MARAVPPTYAHLPAGVPLCAMMWAWAASPLAAKYFGDRDRPSFAPSLGHPNADCGAATAPRRSQAAEAATTLAGRATGPYTGAWWVGASGGRSRNPTRRRHGYGASWLALGIITSAYDRKSEEASLDQRSNASPNEIRASRARARFTYSSFTLLSNPKTQKP